MNVKCKLYEKIKKYLIIAVCINSFVIYPRHFILATVYPRQNLRQKSAIEFLIVTSQLHHNYTITWLGL